MYECIQKMRSRVTTIVSNEMNDTIWTKSEESGLLIKNVNKTIKTEAKEQKGGFLKILLSTLGALGLFVAFVWFIYMLLGTLCALMYIRCIKFI